MRRDKDYYATLGVSKDASAEAIKSAYRTKALESHPDHHPGDTTAEEVFKAVSEAYEILGNPQTRTTYDQLNTLPAPRIRKSFGGFGDTLATIVQKVAATNGTNHQQQEKPTQRTPPDTEFYIPHIRSYPPPKAPSPLLYRYDLQEPKIPRTTIELIKHFHDKDLEAVVARMTQLETTAITEDYDLTARMNQRLIAAATFYAHDISQQVQNITVTGKNSIVTVVAKTADLETMIWVGSCARAILENEQKPANIRGKEYVDLFNRLFPALLPHYNPAEPDKSILAIDQAIKELSHYLTRSTVIKKGSTSMEIVADVLINVLTPEEPLESTIDQLIKVIKSTHGLLGSQHWSRKLEPFHELRTKLKTEKQYTVGDITNLFDIVLTIQRAGTEMEDRGGSWKRKSSLLNTNTASMGQVISWSAGLAEIIAKEDLAAASDFVNAIGLAARGYHKNNPKDVQEAWFVAFNESFSTYKKQRGLFVQVMNAVDELKINAEEKHEWWPGVIHPAMEAVSYFGKTMVEHALTTDNPEKEIKRLKELFQRFRASPYYSHSKDKGKRKGVLEYQVQDYADHEKFIYDLLHSIMRERQGAKIRVLTETDAEEIMNQVKKKK